MEINKPLAHGTTTDIVDHFIAYIVLTIRQENHDGRSTINISWCIAIVSTRPYLSVLQCEVMMFVPSQARR